MRDSIANVWMHKGGSKKLFNADVFEASAALEPIMEKLFDMPSMRPKAGTEAWFAYIKSHMEDVSFEDLVQHFEKLFRNYYKHQRKHHCNKKGVSVLMLLSSVLM